MSLDRLKRLEKKTECVIDSNMKNPYDILTDEELDMAIKKLEAEITGERPIELPIELQEKLNWIEKHPVTKRRNKRMARELEGLSEAEVDEQIHQLLERLDIEI